MFREGSGFTPIGGEITHAGTVSFNSDTVTVGDFTIGFDPSRIGDDASGFFVEDTVAGLGILFDVGVPGALAVGDDDLTIADADLLVSPEFAGFLLSNGLATADLTGADVGDARIDAMTELAPSTFIKLTGLGRRWWGTTVNGGKTAMFSLQDFDHVSVDLGAGGDRLLFRNADLSSSLSVDMGNGNDYVSISSSSIPGAFELLTGAGRDTVLLCGSCFADINIDTGSGDDRLSVLCTSGSQVHLSTGDDRDRVHLLGLRAENLELDLGADRDRVFLLDVRIEGSAFLNGGSGHDRLFGLFSQFGSLEYDNFELSFLR